MTAALPASVLVGLERAALVAEAERLVVLAEADAGVSFPGASRPLYPHEIRCRVRFGAMDQTLKHAERSITGCVREAVDALLAAVRSELPTAGTREDLVAAIAALAVFPTGDVQARLQGFAAKVADVLAAVREAGTSELLGEARDQGIPVESGMAGTGWAAKPWAGQVENAAAGVAGGLWSALLDGMRGAALDTRTETTADAVVGAADAKPYKNVVDAARQETHVQHGAGRADGVAQVPVEPLSVWASELLDGSTCIPCNHIDGKDYATLADALEDYPGMGPYKACEGGNRCRGTLIIEWPEDYDPDAVPEAEPEPDAHPGSSPGWDAVNPVPESGVFEGRYPSMSDMGREISNMPQRAPVPGFKELPVDDGVPDIAEKGAEQSAQEAAAGANYWWLPDHSENCSNVVTAQEFRARGYKVTAKARPEGRPNWEYMGKWIDPRTGQNAWDTAAELPRKTQMSTFMNGLSLGDRGFLSHGWKGSRLSHVTMWEMREEGLMIVEGQIAAEPVPLEKYLDRIKFSSKYPPLVVRSNDLIFVGDPNDFMEVQE